MGLRSRIAALEHDLAERTKQVADIEQLMGRWRTELAEARAQLSAHPETHVPLPRYGVDYAWGRPSVAGLHAHGVSFAMRYLTGEGKALDRTEAKTLSAAGIALVAIFEAGAMNAAQGAGQGTVDGERARHAMAQLGAPHGRPVYMTVDFEPTAQQMAAAMAYLQAAEHALAPFTCGVYGGLATVRAARARGIRWRWQTLAWSHGVWDRLAQVRQTNTEGPTIDGVGCDTDWAYAADFGQWKV